MALFIARESDRVENSAAIASLLLLSFSLSVFDAHNFSLIYQKAYTGEDQCPSVPISKRYARIPERSKLSAIIPHACCIIIIIISDYATRCCDTILDSDAARNSFRMHQHTAGVWVYLRSDVMRALFHPKL